MSNRLLRGIGCVAVTAILWLLPIPAGLSPEAWHIFALFVGTILGFILQPVPNGAVIIISTVVAISTGLLTLKDALLAWSNSTIWLIFAAFMLSRGLIKTGLGKRIAYTVTKAFGDSTLKLAYALSLVDVILSPATPSNSARAGGILYPLAKNLSSSLGSEPGPTARKAGSFLFISLFFADCVCSAMFMTAMVSNPLIVDLAGKTLGLEITWATWFLAASVPAVVSLIVIPLFLRKVYPPELDKIPDAKRVAAEELAHMGPVSFQEKCMAAVFVIVLALWATSIVTKLDVTLIGLIGMVLLIITDVITWRDVLEEKAAWDVFIWLGGIISLAGLMGKFGFITWFAANVSASLAGFPWVAAFLLVVLIYFYSFYGFAGLTTHVAAMFAGFAALAVAVGTPPYLAALALGFSSTLCASVTNYGCVPAAVFYGEGYVDQGTWFKLGFYVSVINLVIWLGLGSAWWKVLGFW